MKKIVCKRIIESLDMCKLKERENHFEIELPIVLFFNQQILTLRLYPTDDGYYICTDGTTFDDCEYDCKQYYDLFIANDKHCHYEIKQDNNYIYKKYDLDRSARTAVDEFVKFFVYLDDYILDYWNNK